MAYPVLGGSILELTFQGLHDGQQVMTVLHYRYASQSQLPNGALALESFLETVTANDQLYDLWKDCLSAKVTDMKAKAQWIWSLRYAFMEKITLPRSGSVAGDAYPPNVAVAITRRGEQANRHNIGTIHMPGVPVSFVTNGLVNPGAEASYATFAQKCLDQVTTPDPVAAFDPIIYTRTGPALSQKPVGYVVQKNSRVMRRRTVGVGS